MTPALAKKLSALLGTRVRRAARVSGGDINQAYVATLEDGRSVFVKTHAKPLPAMFEREAAGLAWLAEAGALALPAVLAATDDDAHGPACLVLEHVHSAPRSSSWDEQLGRGLAALHRFGASHFGLDHDNYLALLPQDNRKSASWPSFYAEQRIVPLVERARRESLLPREVAAQLLEICARMEDLTGPPEPPSRLHGDLWSGNVLTDARGEPCLIDPAVYGGHREIDLAMMRLFGGFSQRTLDAYDESFPLAEGHEARVPLYQLYPLLVHVCLFGSGYVPQLAEAARRAR